MATAKKPPSGNWRVQLYIGETPNDKRRYPPFITNTKKETEYRALQYQLYYKEANRDPVNMTLDKTVERYIPSKDGILPPSTTRGYENIRRNNLEGLMPPALNRITQPIVQKAVNQEAKPYMDKRGRQRVHSVESLHNIHGLLLVVLVEYHPSPTLCTRLPQEGAREQRILGPEQMAALLRAVEGNVTELSMLTGLWLCMRASEISDFT